MALGFLRDRHRRAGSVRDGSARLPDGIPVHADLRLAYSSDSYISDGLFCSVCGAPAPARNYCGTGHHRYSLVRRSSRRFSGRSEQ